MGIPRVLYGLTAALALAGCEGASSPGPEPTFIADGNPPTLSDWGMLAARDGQLIAGEGVEPYDLVTPLFSDHAGKFRTVWMPEGASAHYSEDGVFDFPVGTVITKTFFYANGPDGGLMRGDEATNVWAEPEVLDLSRVHLVETRILVRREEGWTALPYVWNAEQTEARLMRTGDAQTFEVASAAGGINTVNYLVPNVNQCAGCHATNNTTRQIQPIGPAARHLNREFDYAEGTGNQLEHLIAVGYLTGAPAAGDAPRAADWTDTSLPIGDRARAWLDINCAHCHNPAGPADTSGLYLDPGTEWGPNFGLCKTPIAAGPGSGGHRYDIVPGDPDQSILIFRLESLRPDVMMPELGRSIVHEESVALIREWIETLDGDCDA
ncbi:SO2930 family diheme c-type cytochrome [Hyphobacterium marinum]|uniref:SO2930 family diheme c-type cytochrome n=1 Tax=Hyphobacterium marinum TaxID=3116574 RepID=A0ABU7LZ09_9PROT|nr:SO2930 family diheme c-type cytochrome [Hyphobacterium sp. Y6023]MEE2566765.1 SO2930 family diheme c-type cytochrome [Hyphobacterium sp. Y6023]